MPSSSEVKRGSPLAASYVVGRIELTLLIRIEIIRRSIELCRRDATRVARPAEFHFDGHPAPFAYLGRSNAPNRREGRVGGFKAAAFRAAELRRDGA